MLDVDKVIEDFPILHEKRDSKRLVYLDSAATSQKPMQVIDKVSEYYKSYNANVHRGIYGISVKATDEYIRSKELAAKLINADSYRNIVYTRNATEALNVLALSWAGRKLRGGDGILLTEMEHHSNIVPWQMLKERKNTVMDYITLDAKKRFLDMEDFEMKLEAKPKIVSFTAASNVLGSITEMEKMTKMAHDAGAMVIIDGAQAVPHMPIDVKRIDCDFMAFSSHKMLGPSGIGVLYGKEELLDQMEPLLGGGDMIRSVDFESCTYNELPWKFESGTPNIEGAIGFGAAIEYLNNIGMDNVREHEKEITAYAIKRLRESGVIVYGPQEDQVERRTGAVSFKISGAHPHDVAQILDSENVAIRAGHHCAMPLVNQVLNEDSVSRMSFYIYNNKEDVEAAIDALAKVKKVLKLH